VSAVYLVDGEPVDEETIAREIEKRRRTRIEAVLASIALRAEDEPRAS
jgi:hypothetical protein